MITEEIFSDELLQQAVAELAAAINNSLPPPAECQHKFSHAFEEKMCSLISGIGTKCYTVSIQNSVIHK